jgi:cold shock CspA family protein
MEDDKGFGFIQPDDDSENCFSMHAASKVAAADREPGNFVTTQSI